MSSGSSIPERRLRPLWDAIESGQFKPALKLANTLLTKYPDSAYALALKALVLEQVGKPDEALTACRQAKDKKPTDDPSLSTLQIVYQRLGHLDEASLCYEYACSRNSGNLELWMALFNSYVRQYNFVKQQQTAMKMYKNFGNEDKYLLWAVCSIYLQASPSNQAAPQLITLAEGLIRKMMDSNGIKDLEALRLYIDLLQQQEKHEVALETLSGSLSALFTDGLELLRLRGDLLLRLHQYDRAAAVFKEILLVVSADDWAAVKDYINATLETLEDDQKRSARLNELCQVMRSLQETQHQEFVRAPWLALVEIQSRRPGCDLVAASIVEYFERFGHLASFFSDVRCYINLLDDPSKKWLYTQLRTEEPSTGLKHLRRRISVYQVAEYIGAGLSVTEIAELFKSNLPLSKDLDPQDSIIGEELLVITANLLIKAYITSKRFGFLLEAVCVLEYGLSLRSFNFRYKAMLVSLYSTVYAVSMALSWFKDLDVKSILYEAASHHILPEMLSSPLLPELETLLKSLIKFNEDYPRDAGEMAILAYKHGNYTKILEFVELKEKLQNSHQHLLAKAELVLLSLKTAVDAEEIFENLDHGKTLLQWCSDDKMSKLSFNEDFDVRPWWSPFPDENLLTGLATVSTDDGKVAQRQDRWKAHVKRRCLLPRLLFLASNAFPTGKQGWEGCHEFSKIFASYIEGFGLTLESVSGFLSEFVPSSSRSVVDVVTISFLWLAPQLSKGVDEALLSLTIVEDVWERAARNVTGSLTSSTGPEAAIITGTQLSALFMLTSEALGWFCLCLQAWIKRLQPVSKKKKKPVDGTDQRLVDGLRTLVGVILRELENVNALLVKRADTSQDEEVAEMSSLLRTSPEDENAPGMVLKILHAPLGDAVLRDMVASQRVYLSGVQTMLTSKLNFLKSIKF